MPGHLGGYRKKGRRVKAPAHPRYWRPQLPGWFLESLEEEKGRAVRGDPLGDLKLSKVTDGGKKFETGVKVTFDFMHNTVKSPWVGERFQQDIEPTGYYVNVCPDVNYFKAKQKEGFFSTFVTGRVTLNNPLVLEFGPGYTKGGWKDRLHRLFGAKREELRKALVASGYDGIVTTDENGTREIVLLTHEVVRGMEPKRQSL
jgi:hypothetical protein